MDNLTDVDFLVNPPKLLKTNKFPHLHNASGERNEITTTTTISPVVTTPTPSPQRYLLNTSKESGKNTTAGGELSPLGVLGKSPQIEKNLSSSMSQLSTTSAPSTAVRSTTIPSEQVRMTISTPARLNSSETKGSEGKIPDTGNAGPSNLGNVPSAQSSNVALATQTRLPTNLTSKDVGGRNETQAIGKGQGYNKGMSNIQEDDFYFKACLDGHV